MIDEIIDNDQFIDNHYLFPEPLHGSDTFKGIAATFRKAMPDVHLIIEDVIGEHDRVLLRWSMTGSHQGELMGVAPTNRPLRVTGMVVVRFNSEGRIVERWVTEDALGLMKQLGLVN